LSAGAVGEIARYLASAGKALTWPQKVAAVAAKFGVKGTSEQSLNRISKAVEKVAPINFGPVLMAAYGKGKAAKADTSPEAWAFFLTTIPQAGEGYTLRQAWRNTRDLGQGAGMGAAFVSSRWNGYRWMVGRRTSGSASASAGRSAR